MLHSLDRLSQLPDTTRVCCAHEYTLSNLRFAQAVEPGNTQLLHYRMHCETLRAQGQPTLPSTIALERAINPFLRTRTGPVVQAARALDASHATDSEAGVFAAIRQWKNTFT
jgi:hydroxyacylglutathione hydrolase